MWLEIRLISDEMATCSDSKGLLDVRHDHSYMTMIILENIDMPCSTQFAEVVESTIGESFFKKFLLFLSELSDCKFVCSSFFFIFRVSQRILSCLTMSFILRRERITWQ